ncbi:MAG: family 20 glycosylhydrolase [Lachnospiraceae bacterium]
MSNVTITRAAEPSVTEDELITRVNPILKSYEISDSQKLWKVSSGTRFVVEASGETMDNSRLQEVVKLMNAEFAEKEIPSADPHIMTYAAESQRLADDIFIRLVDAEDISSDTTSEEAYRITIDESGVIVEAASENAVIYALRTIMTLMITNDGLIYGTILDYPDLAERRLHVDCARKYISKDWFIRQIREMSYLKMNTIQIHFSENLGFRIECETDPAIVSDEYLTKAEVREILAEAEKYGIKVIPSFDSPGHVDQILKAHPEYGQVSNSGKHYASGLDVTNPEAVAYIYSLYEEYMELFEGCTDFHIGGDEYMEFDRAPFTTEYKSVLDNYAAETFGAGYTWKDTIANYINELAEFVYDHGFKPRIWNDGIYYGENSSSPQKIRMHDYIGIDFWSQMSWNSSIARLQTILDHGHTDIYNMNASYFYYVLRNTAPTDGREQHSFDVLNQDKNIYETWTPGKFQANTISDDNPVIKGASMAIWCDKADLCTEDVIAEDIASALRALACKSWNTSANSKLNFSGFQTLIDEIGHAAAYEKGSVLPDAGEFTQAEDLGRVLIRYVDTDGNPIKESDIKYGVLGSSYEITAPEIYRWIAQNTEAVTGTYSETDREIVFVYDVDPDPEKFDSDMLTYPSVTEYKTAGGKFALEDSSRIFVVSNDRSLHNTELENDMKLLSSEFCATGLTEASMDIVYGPESSAKSGDIVVCLEEENEGDNGEAYEIEIEDFAKVTATDEAGIFYGVRMIQKTLLLNDGSMDCGIVKDEPSVSVRGFHMDNARKFFTKDWILAMIKDLSYQNINTLQFHFSENEGYRLESSTLEAIDGFQYPSNGYLTKEDMLDIIAECNKYHIELVPSLDSPGHMTYVLNYLPDDWDCTSIWPGDWRSPQTFNIFEKEECRQFLADLFREYAEFFSEAGCKHINIGGDEFLNNFGSMTNDQYIIVMNYFNEISALVKSYGLTPRAWNDGLLYKGYTGYTLDPDIEICYWSGPAQCATIAEFVENGNKVINFTDVYMYFALSSWWMNNANASGQKIFNEWHPGKLASSNVIGSQEVAYPYEDYVLGASYALWCDNPNYMTQDAVSSNLFMRTRAMAEKSWNPNTGLTYTQFESLCSTLGRAPGYDSELPESGNIYYDGELGFVTLRYLDESGKEIRKERNVYGLVNDPYEIVPDTLYGYRFVSMDKEASGIFSKDGIVITLTYQMYTDKTALREKVDQAIPADSCIPETYTDYGRALDEAKKVLDDPSADQRTTDDALEALINAESRVISLERLDLYLEVNYPIASAGYTNNSYAAYSSAVNEGKKTLLNRNASAEDVDAALEAILSAKASLAPADMITVSANQDTYQTYYLSNIIDGNQNTYAWLASAQNIDDYVLFTFRTPVILNSVRILTPSNAGSDCFHHAVVEISADGEEWTEIGTLEQELDKTFNAEGAAVQYVRIRVTEFVKYWTKIAEATFDYELTSIDKSALENAIADAKKLNKDEYTAASWAVLEAALRNAEELNEKTSITTGEMNAVIKALKAAEDNLRIPEGGEPEPLPNPFTDVTENDFFYHAVLWAVENGITDGWTEELFAPDMTVTRAQAVTFLWRAGGCEKASALAGFTDVPADEYYAEAAAWAVENGITDGWTEELFAPNMTVTRAQAVTFLWRAGGCEKASALADFTDVPADEYYAEAVAWAVENGITDGWTEELFAPDHECTRGQIVTFLYLAENI